jgi:hypothetical protein
MQKIWLAWNKLKAYKICYMELYANKKIIDLTETKNAVRREKNHKWHSLSIKMIYESSETLFFCTFFLINHFCSIFLRFFLVLLAILLQTESHENQIRIISLLFNFFKLIQRHKPQLKVVISIFKEESLKVPHISEWNKK